MRRGWGRGGGGGGGGWILILGWAWAGGVSMCATGWNTPGVLA